MYLTLDNCNKNGYVDLQWTYDDLDNSVKDITLYNTRIHLNDLIKLNVEANIIYTNHDNIRNNLEFDVFSLIYEYLCENHPEYPLIKVYDYDNITNEIKNLIYDDLNIQFPIIYKYKLIITSDNQVNVYNDIDNIDNIDDITKLEDLLQ